MNYNKDNGLLNMIRRTDPMIVWEECQKCGRDFKQIWL